MLEIKEDTHLFYIGDSAKNKLAYLEFFKRDSVLIINYVHVSPELRGQGVGQQLIQYAVDYTRLNRLTITPVCSYAAYQLFNHPEYGDVLNT